MGKIEMTSPESLEGLSLEIMLDMVHREKIENKGIKVIPAKDLIKHFDKKTDYPSINSTLLELRRKCYIMGFNYDGNSIYPWIDDHIPENGVKLFIIVNPKYEKYLKVIK